MSTLGFTQTNNLLPGIYVKNFHIPAAHFHNLASNPKLKYGFCDTSKSLSFSPVKNVRRKGSGLVCLNCKTLSLMEEHDDSYYMRRCVELARRAVGFTSPNPMVGCVIVKDGKIVGQGFHPKAGQPHAEVFALRDAGDLAENGTAYVSLEPCNHYGRTPPCTEALIRSKVKKVVVGMVDPNPIVASTGLDKLRSAGIEVVVGVEEELCKKLNEAYIHQMLSGKPFVTLRYSMSVNGRLLDQLGDGVMEPGGYYSKLMQENDAVVFSSDLLSMDSSFPASKEPGANQPLRIVLKNCPSSHVKNSALINETNSKIIFFTEKETIVEHEAAHKGIETVVLERMQLSTILEHCKRQGICSLVVDLRGDHTDFEEILREGISHDLFQKFVVEMLPIWSGTEGNSLWSITEKVNVKKLITTVVCDHLLLEGYF